MPVKKKRPFNSNIVILRAATAMAAVAGVLCFVVSSLLIVNYWQVSTLDPMNHPELLRLRGQLTGSPEADAATIEAIRAMDLLARATFFTSRRMLRTGGLLALLSGIVFVIALRVAANCRPRLPEPSAEPPQQYYWADQARARELLVFTGGLWLLVALLAAAFTRLDIPMPTTEELQVATEEVPPADAPAAQELVIPGWEEIQKQWPNFRGPGGYGIAHHTNAPTDWDGVSGKNVRWKTAVPLPGFNSPVVWGNRVYLSGADAEKREVYAFDAATGSLLWQTAIGTQIPVAPPKVNDDTGYAAATLAVQDKIVCAIFGTGHLACLGDDGVIRWEKHLGVPDNHYGHSSSLIIYEDLVIVQYDQRKNGALYAFALKDGAEIWKQDRTRISWASPILTGMPDAPLITVVSSRDMDVYAPRTGELRWTIECLSGEVGPSPAYGAGMFFVANEYADSSAIRLPAKDASADAAAEPEIVWQYYEALPDISSPLATDTFFYLLTSRGEIICLRPETGEMAWMHEHENPFFSSAVLVGDRIYAIDKEGMTLIFKNAGEYQEIARPQFGEPTVTTPAIMDGCFYVRTVTSLLCIAQQE
jgi:outer membrane protein assembly factor BamB